MPLSGTDKLASLTAGGSGQGAQNTSQLMLNSSPLVPSQYMPYPSYSSPVFMQAHPISSQTPYGQQTQVPFNQNQWRRPKQVPSGSNLTPRCNICLVEYPAQDHFRTCEFKQKGQRKCFLCRKIVPFSPGRAAAFVEHLKKCRPSKPCKVCNEWHHISICDRHPARNVAKLVMLVGTAQCLRVLLEQCTLVIRAPLSPTHRPNPYANPY